MRSPLGKVYQIFPEILKMRFSPGIAALIVRNTEQFFFKKAFKRNIGFHLSPDAIFKLICRTIVTLCFFKINMKIAHYNKLPIARNRRDSLLDWVVSNSSVASTMVIGGGA